MLSNKSLCTFERNANRLRKVFVGEGDCETELQDMR